VFFFYYVRTEYFLRGLLKIGMMDWVCVIDGQQVWQGIFAKYELKKLEHTYKLILSFIKTLFKFDVLDLSLDVALP